MIVVSEIALVVLFVHEEMKVIKSQLLLSLRVESFNNGTQIVNLYGWAQPRMYIVYVYVLSYL